MNFVVTIYFITVCPSSCSFHQFSNLYSYFFIPPLKEWSVHWNHLFFPLFRLSKFHCNCLCSQWMNLFQILFLALDETYIIHVSHFGCSPMLTCFVSRVMPSTATQLHIQLVHVIGIGKKNHGNIIPHRQPLAL